MARVRSKNPRGRGAELRGELVAAANAVLDETGDPSSVTVRGVAGAVGVAPNAVYLHFADREELLAAVMVDRFTEFGDRIRAAVDAAGADALAALRAGHRAYIDFAHYRLLFGPGEVRPERPDLAEQVLSVAFAAFELCVGLCRRGVEADVFAPVDPEQLARSIWAMEHGYADLARTERGGLLPDPDTILDTILAAAAPR